MKIRYLELMARWYVFIFLNHYGLGKIIGGQFYVQGDLPADLAVKTVTELSSFELAWTFMGHSFYYVLFIGLSEMIGAWCLIWERTKLVGVAILLPIMVNIMVFDVIFLDRYGALASATIYTALLLVILFVNRDTVRKVVRIATNVPPPVRGTSRIKTAVIVVGLMAALFAVDQLFVNLFGHGKG